MGGVLPELIWKVRTCVVLMHEIVHIQHLYLYLGDVTLSAEDLSAHRLALQVPKEDAVEESGYDPDDYDEEYLDDYLDDWLEREEHEALHNWLQGGLAAKFLLAGGVAGAGETFRLTFLHSESLLYQALSVKNVYCTFRSPQNLLDNPTTGPRWDVTRTGSSSSWC